MTSFNENPILLKRSLDSILNQTFLSYNLIIVIEFGDKNSKIFEEYKKNDNRVKLFFNQLKLGFPASLNKGIGLCESKYIARIDSDDICHLERFEKQIDYLENNPKVDILGTWLTYSNNGTIRTYPEFHNEIRDIFLFSTGIAHPSVILKSELFVKFGAYNVSFHKAEDLELWLRLIKNGCTFHNLQEVLLTYHVTFPDSPLEGRNGSHFFYNYLARKMHSSYIYPLLSSKVSLSLFWMMSKAPRFLYGPIDFFLSRKIKKIISDRVTL